MFNLEEMLVCCSDEVKVVLSKKAEENKYDKRDIIGMAHVLRELLQPEALNATVADIYTVNGLLCVEALEKEATEG